MTLHTPAGTSRQPPEPGALARVYGNAGKLLGGKALAGLIGLVYLALATRALGPSLYGVMVLISFYVVLTGSFGVLQGWHTIVRYGSAPGVLQDPEAFKRLFAFTALVELLSGAVTILLVALLAQQAGRWFGWPAKYDPLAALYALAVFAAMHNTASGALYLFGRVDLLSAQQIAGPLARLVGAAIASWAGASLPGFLIAWLVGAITEGLIDWWLVLRELRRRGLHEGLWRWPRGVTADHPGIWKFLLTSNLDGSIADAGNRITPLVIGAALNPAAVGLYHLALRIGMVLQQPISALGRSIYPELALFAARGDLAGIRHLVVRTGAIAMSCGLLVSLIFVLFGKPILHAVGGPGFDGAYLVLLMIGLACTVNLLGFSFSAALVALGKPYWTLWVNLATTLALLPMLNLWLHSLGVLGAGLHAFSCALFSVGILATLLLRRAASKQLVSI